MFRVENKIGRLLEVHVTNLANMEEMGQFRMSILQGVSGTAGKTVAVVDLRQPRIFAPEVATALEQMLEKANPKIERSAVLLAREHAVFSLQLERIVREAANPSRRTFRDSDQLQTWLKDLLTPAEQNRLGRFLG
jgi:hypothetical protein